MPAHPQGAALHDAHPTVSKIAPFANFPIRRLELVKCNSGIIASGNCSPSTTWLSVSRSLTAFSPRTPMTITAGMIASRRVINRRTHGRTRQCINPSITT